MIPDFPNVEPIGFRNLMSLNVKHRPGSPLPKKELKYLIQDSPLAEVTITEGNLTVFLYSLCLSLHFSF